MKTLKLTPAVLAALGEGVDRLNDGDPAMRAQADAVVADMAARGFRKEGNAFREPTRVDLAWETILEALGPRSPLALSPFDQDPIRRLADGYNRQAVLSNPNLLWDWSHVRDSSDGAILKMAEAIQAARETRG